MPNQNNFEKLPVFRVSAGSFTMYDLPEIPSARSLAQRENEINLSRGKYNGYMSPKTRSKVKKYLGSWINAIDRLKVDRRLYDLDFVPQIVFVTLTLSSYQIHKDNQIKRKLLMPFIETLKRKHNVKEYFWRAESQKNGNIHFHLLIDSHIPWYNLRSEWNKAQNKLGYVDRYQENHSKLDLKGYIAKYSLFTKCKRSTLERRYEKGVKSNWANPNSTDIRELYKVQNKESYIIKYSCKSDGYRPIKGRIHGASNGLKSFQPYSNFIDQKANEMIKAAFNDQKSKVVADENFTIIFCNTQIFIDQYYPSLNQDIDNYYFDKLKQLYNKQHQAKINPSKVPKFKRIIQSQQLEMCLPSF